jgi:hypothetical protein
LDCNELKFSRHALVQMFARSISKEEAIKVINNGEVIANYPDDQPYPSKLFLGYVNKRPIHVVAGYDADEKTCILITVYQPDLDIWESDHKTRRK